MKQLAPLAIVLSLLTTTVMAQDDAGKTHEAERYRKAFPAAADGMKRYVIMLPEKTRDEEGDFRVELIVGKKIMTDGVNRYFMGGKLESKPLKGWGFTYYELAAFGPAGSTRMGVPPGTPPVEKLVTIPSQLIRYNSRVPLVVYVPADGEVQYRIWTAPETNEVAEEG